MFRKFAPQTPHDQRLRSLVRLSHQVYIAFIADFLRAAVLGQQHRPGFVGCFQRNLEKFFHGS